MTITDIYPQHGLNIFWNFKVRPKIKFYLFGIVARPTEKLAAQIILFAFQTIFFIKKIGIAPEF
jgi:hypothetical protein